MNEEAKPKKEKPPKRGENPEEIAKLLKDIEKAEKDVQVAEIELDSRKEAAKSAKAEWMVKVASLRECVRTRERWAAEAKRQPLLNPKPDKPVKLPDGAKKAVSVGILRDVPVKSGTILMVGEHLSGLESTPAASVEWRRMAIEKLTGEVTEKDLDKLAGANILTLGDLQDLMTKNGSWWARAIKGIGEAGQTRIEDSFNRLLMQNA